MNTPAHLIVGTALFAREDRRGTYISALAGSAAPDVSLYVMVAVSIWGMGVPAQTVFREYYYSDAWQSVFAVDNSFVLWGLLLALAVWRGWTRVIAFSGAGLAHLTLDFPLHTHDARQHFWPITDWVFESPFSYWDHSAHAGVIGPFELGISVVLAAVLVRSFRSWRVRIATGVFLVAELFTSSVWRMLF
ncbi:cobalamin biosynthesis protein CobQ [bacterium]|nr:cobalamin biosynthesis protein CobQ [bacterium]